VKIRISVAAAFAAGACLILAAPPATAATGDIMVYTTDAGHPAAFAWFYPYGEAWGVCDDQADGKRAIAQLKDLTAGVQYGLVDDTGYDNTCARANTDFNITDGHRVALRVCLRDGALGPITACSAWKETTA
jgi:hypothetical protein